MRIALVGLGRMGGNMARRLCRGEVEVVGVNRTAAVTQALAAEEGLIPARDLADAIGQLEAPRIVWLMLPQGAPTEGHFKQAMERLEPGDILVDGGNANYRDSLRRAQIAAIHGVHFVDAGTSGGVWGLEIGYCLMAGGAQSAIEVLRPVFDVLAPPDGWTHVGPPGAGHYTKMIHNGIEYGMMQALAEGLALLRAKGEFNLDVARISELWRHGSVVRSWLLDLTADALKEDAELSDIAPYVSDSGEGRWTVLESVDLGVAAPVITLALQMRFASQDETGYANRALAAMRNAFGGHAIKEGGDKE